MNARGIAREFFFENDGKKHERIIEHCFIDPKNSEHYLTETVLQITEKRQIIDERKTCFDRSPDFKIPPDFLFFMTYLSFDMTRLVSYLLYTENVALLSLTTNRMYPRQIVEKPTFFFSYEASYSLEMQTKVQELLDEIDVSYMAVLYSKEYPGDKEEIHQDCSRRPDSAFCYYLKLDTGQHQKCYKEVFIDYKNETQFNQTLYDIVGVPNLRFLTFYGPYNSLDAAQEHPLLYRWFFNVGYDSPFFIIPFERSLTEDIMKQIHRFIMSSVKLLSKGIMKTL